MSNPIAHSTINGEVLIYPHITHTDFTLEVHKFSVTFHGRVA